MNQAPASAANQAPNAAKARLALPSKIRPPAAAAMPGTISSHSRAGVYTQGPRNGMRAPHAPSTTSTTPLSAPRLRGTRSKPAMFSPPFADIAPVPIAEQYYYWDQYPAKARNHGRVFAPDSEGSGWRKRWQRSQEPAQHAQRTRRSIGERLGKVAARREHGLVAMTRSRMARSSTRLSTPSDSVILETDKPCSIMSATQSSTWDGMIRRTGIEPNRGSIRGRRAVS
jgi:hypothetical protein